MCHDFHHETRPQNDGDRPKAVRPNVVDDVREDFVYDFGDRPRKHFDFFGRHGPMRTAPDGEDFIENRVRKHFYGVLHVDVPEHRRGVKPGGGFARGRRRGPFGLLGRFMRVIPGRGGGFGLVFISTGERYARLTAAFGFQSGGLRCLGGFLGQGFVCGGL